MSQIMFISELYQFLRFVCVYYATTLGFCAIMSYFVIGIIMLLRKEVFRNCVFGKAALWSLMILVLFCGKLHVYFENKIGVRFFLWWYTLCSKWNIVSLVYILIGIAIAFYFVRRRCRLYNILSELEEYGKVNSKFKIKKFSGEVTSFCTGCIKPIIAIPEGIDKEETEIILRHEETHIMLGHLWIQLFWEIMIVLFWINPFLYISEKYLLRDLEDICDAVTIQRNGINELHYADILLENAKRMNCSGGMSFSPGDNYQALKKRIENITAYKKYNEKHITAMLIIISIKTISYARYNSIGYSSVFSVEKMDTLLIDDNSTVVTGYDDDYIYIDCAELKRQCPKIVTETEDIYFTVGGYYKIPGMGGGSDIGWISPKELTDGRIKIRKYSGIDIWNRIIMWI